MHSKIHNYKSEESKCSDNVYSPVFCVNDIYIRYKLTYPTLTGIIKEFEQTCGNIICPLCTTLAFSWYVL